MSSENGKGAADVNNDAQNEITSNPSIDANRKERNLIRRINRKLKLGNRKLCCIRDNTGERLRFLVDTSNPVTDVEGFGRRIGVANCILCNRPAKWKDGDCDVCIDCFWGLKSGRLHSARGCAMSERTA